MKHLWLFEEFLKLQPLNEIGDASAQPFKWTQSQNIAQEVKSFIQRLIPGTSANLNFAYYFENDQGVEYIVLLQGQLQNKLKNPFDSRPGIDYDSYYVLSYNTVKNFQKNVETETNLGEVYRIMSTVTSIVIDFLEQVKKSGYPVKSLAISAKDDSKSGVSSMESRRGRLYANYIKKQLSKLGGDYRIQVSDDRVELKWVK